MYQSSLSETGEGVGMRGWGWANLYIDKQRKKKKKRKLNFAKPQNPNLYKNFNYAFSHSTQKYKGSVRWNYYFQYVN